MLKLKLDENFSPSLAILFIEAGYDTETVLDERLSGEPDDVIYLQCLKEERCIVTLDLDFADIIRFPTENTSGIIAIRPNRPITMEVLKSMAIQLVDALRNNSPENCLWIIEPGRLRIRKPKS